MKKSRKSHSYTPLPIEMVKRYARLIIEEDPATSDDEEISTSNEPNIVEKVKNIFENIVPDMIRKIRDKSYSITMDDSTRRIIGTDRDLRLTAISMLEILDLSLEDELITEVVGSGSTHDEYVFGLSREHMRIISEICQYAKISCFFWFFRILK